MNDDRELLELAAKANRLDDRWVYEERIRGSEFPGCPDSKVFGLYKNNICWNPLTDDGDALRLAVKLGINLELHNINLYGAYKGSIQCECEGEPYAATRRAIVRAAAEIGRAL